MKSYPDSRPRLADALILLAVLALAAVVALWQFSARTESTALTVVVEIDAVEADRFPLESLETHTYSNNGVTLTLAPYVGRASTVSSQESELSRGICVSTSDCPTGDCVRTGVITRAGQSIVCLPGRIVVTLEGAQTDFDVIAG